MADSLGLGVPLSSGSPVYTVYAEHTKGNENCTMALPGNAERVAGLFTNSSGNEVLSGICFLIPDNTWHTLALTDPKYTGNAVALVKLNTTGTSLTIACNYTPLLILIIGF